MIPHTALTDESINTTFDLCAYLVYVTYDENDEIVLSFNSRRRVNPNLDFDYEVKVSHIGCDSRERGDSNYNLLIVIIFNGIR